MFLRARDRLHVAFPKHGSVNGAYILTLRQDQVRGCVSSGCSFCISVGSVPPWPSAVSTKLPALQVPRKRDRPGVPSIAHYQGATGACCVLRKGLAGHCPRVEVAWLSAHSPSVT